MAEMSGFVGLKFFCCICYAMRGWLLKKIPVFIFVEIKKYEHWIGEQYPIYCQKKEVRNSRKALPGEGTIEMFLIGRSTSFSSKFSGKKRFMLSRRRRSFDRVETPQWHRCQGNEIPHGQVRGKRERPGGPATDVSQNTEAPRRGRGGAFWGPGPSAFARKPSALVGAQGLSACPGSHPVGGQ